MTVQNNINIPLPAYLEKLVDSFHPGDAPHLYPRSSGPVTLLMDTLIRRGKYPVLLVENEVFRENIYDGILSFHGEDSIAYLISPSGTIEGKDPEGTRFRNQLHHYLIRRLDNRGKALCASPEILNLPLPDAMTLERRKIRFEKNGEYLFEWVLLLLEEDGYQRAPVVEHNGEFAVRGGILDVYLFGRTYPLRLEFFGDTLESIREFNPNSQLSTRELDHFIFLPNPETQTEDTLFQLLPPETVVIGEEHTLPDSGFPSVVLSPDLQTPDFQPWAPTPGAQPHSILEKEHAEGRELFLFYDHELLVKGLKSRFEQLDGILFVPRILHSSFYDTVAGRIYINCDDMFHVEHMVNPDKHFIPEYGEVVEAPSSLKYGDYVLHSDYGLGRYLGLETLSHGSVKQDVLVVEFNNGDKVYVSLKYISKIFKYSGSDSHAPHLASLRRSTWEGTRRSVRNSVKAIAEDLLRLYGQRQQALGFAFSSNRESLRDIEDSFPHTETPDQKKVIDEIFTDMESSRVMDRLVCGDVGFGKTEVAIRAAFKAILNGKQVAVLVPTTILSIQHHENFEKRLEPFGIQVDILNRFRKSAQLSKLYKDLSEGRTDVLIGTHKMLSEKVVFRDLGLLVIDEEHRFGVRDKEKIKQIKQSVDVITMTATPIPRTLEFSLMGLRDISKIETPPKERMPILTRIMHWSPDSIREAAERELKRNGQIIVLSNNIGSLDAIRSRFSKLVPGARVRSAHGQMAGPDLEKQLIDFYHHEYDILISTTIIESGIDIPNANTLIVFDAHNFGLSQLYQIRGRVGRSHRRAYAYLIIPSSKSISVDAEKRLRTLEYYTDLGSGYHIAMKDLEIRGGGNLFGTVQSGFINHVGYDYYISLLNEEIEKLKRGTEASDNLPDFAPDVNLDLDSYIPENYIANGNLKLDQYRILGKCGSEEDLARFINNLRDRYGPLPPQVNTLVFEKRVSLALLPFHVEKVVIPDREIVIYFIPSEDVHFLQLNASKLSDLCHRAGKEIYFSTRKGLSARLPLHGEHPVAFLTSLLGFNDRELLIEIK